MKNMDTLELIKNDSTSIAETIKMREAFVSRYCMNKGWDKENLSFEQIVEIRAHQEWKAPGMIRS